MTLSTGLRFAEVKVGDELPMLTKHPTTRQLVQYAGASGDFYEIHYDRPFAEAGGLPGVILHGLLKAGWLGELVQGWAGPNAFVRHIEASYRGIDEPGRPYHLKGKVVSVQSNAEPSSGGIVELEVWGEDERQRRTTLGSARVELDA
ncbi:MAG: dehydratase [Chloroflexi bacterium]|nr:dehydratase [Chloroflexota bacterium]